jgi:hypothetical protein
LQLLHSPITAEQYREKTRPLRPRRSCFAPAETRSFALRAWVEAPGAAPGSEWFIAAAIYFHSRRTGSLNIGGKVREKQSFYNVFRPEIRCSSTGTRRIGLALRRRPF